LTEKNPKLALKQIQAFGNRLHKKNHSALFFQREHEVKMETKKFQKSGLLCLFQSMPMLCCSNKYWKFLESLELIILPDALGCETSFNGHHPKSEHEQAIEFIERFEKYIQRG
jgi:hypothetical protein